jgi:hypothetical protein
MGGKKGRQRAEDRRQMTDDRRRMVEAVYLELRESGNGLGDGRQKGTKRTKDGKKLGARI